ncbi:MAG: helix-turn-helix transcriptional regulator [Desulfofustis sp. PB-SRB1]|nr:helix-turn-helix transcriptional regulator [Desulfofustis sp. PB-SRB1]
MVNKKIHSKKEGVYCGKFITPDTRYGIPGTVKCYQKEKGLTQQKLAKLVGLHVAQVRRYEGGTSQPTLEVIRKLAVALSVSARYVII